MKSDATAYLLCGILMLIGTMMILCPLFYEAGQGSIIKSCERTSFFYVGSKTFECLPYTKGMLDPHPQPNLVPR